MLKWYYCAELYGGFQFRMGRIFIGDPIRDRWMIWKVVFANKSRTLGWIWNWMKHETGVKTEAMSHIHIILRTDVVLKRSVGSLELRLIRSGIFKHNFMYVMLKCLPTRPRHLLLRPRPRPRPSVLRLRPRPRHSVSRPRRDRGIWNFNWGETEPRHYCTSRRPRDRGVKTEATSLKVSETIHLMAVLCMHGVCSGSCEWVCCVNI